MLKHVTLYACENAMGLSLGLSHDVFAFASMLQKKLLGEAISISLVTLDGKAISSFSGLSITPDQALGDIKHTDLVILHGIWGNMEALLIDQRPLYPKLREWHEQGIPIMAATTGSYFLAEAGLLDERICTTHWHKQEEFAQKYPKIDLRPDRFITATGELYCSAGMNAAMEIMIYLLSRLSCTEVGEAVESTFLVDFRRAYSGEFASIGKQTYHQDDAILSIQQWLEIHFIEPLSIEQLATKANMSVRTFKRRFKEATGESPLSYIQHLKIEQGKEHLKHSDQSVAEISWKVGYQDPGHFNRLFQRKYGLSPAAWRKKLR
ncbi:AraC family transcriptional regulator [Oleiphilus sp. HI0068]|nr:AraC family transcriptional regulator [Oleiphilus sp. HI0061]KZY81960.1 AraC family transcriptional regulator [Oleiphilus sp. HI0068]KZY87640.1 AraC family transcriptional regulator [Oleiphilus sp. HI0069]KZZ39917.1 AraC family transcriptional regulator [Oleiphilus sp. HI0085]